MSDLRAIAEAATPGPWVDQEPGPSDPGAGTRWIDTHAYPDGPEPVLAPDFMVSAADAVHIAAWSPDRALAALDVIEAARRLRDDWIGDPDFGPALDPLLAALKNFDGLP